MDEFHLIPATQPLYVEGITEDGGIGEFRGRVIAIGVHGTNTVIPAEPNGTDPATESLFGWGSTHLLVADETKKAPLWVSKKAVTSHRVSAPAEVADNEAEASGNGAVAAR
jgi:hypothetical protein